uniref:Cytochrome P450 n=1 Tax=Oryza barthii TaxID=65489 RepID=A0A0D3FD29_9ORYZ
MAPPRANSGDGNDGAVGGQSKLSPSGLPIREIPGGYGVPFFSPLRDRLDYYYFQGADEFFRSRVARHGGATVLGGHRPLAFLDAADPRHAKIKRVVMSLAAARMHHVAPAFRAAFAAMFDAVEAGLGAAVEFNKLNMRYMLDFTCAALFGGEPPSKVVGDGAVTKAMAWLAFQLHPIASKVVRPWPLEELLLHTFSLPPFLVRRGYATLKAYFADAAAAVLDDAEKNHPGIPRDELLDNLVFVAIFNAFGGFKIFLPHIKI